MNDLSDLSGLESVEGADLTESQIKGILAQIDLDITNLLRDGKLSALKYGLGGEGGQKTDRAANLKALLEARKYYEHVLKSLPSWEITQAEDDEPG